MVELQQHWIAECKVLYVKIIGVIFYANLCVFQEHIVRYAALFILRSTISYGKEINIILIGND